MGKERTQNKLGEAKPVFIAMCFLAVSFETVCVSLSEIILCILERLFPIHSLCNKAYFKTVYWWK